MMARIKELKTSLQFFGLFHLFWTIFWYHKKHVQSFTMTLVSTIWPPSLLWS
jgi:hypothetical protein